MNGREKRKKGGGGVETASRSKREETLFGSTFEFDLRVDDCQRVRSRVKEKETNRHTNLQTERQARTDRDELIKNELDIDAERDSIGC